MKSIYQNKDFATYWNLRAGNNGEPYKRLVLDPLMLEAIGSMKNKTILELGCGNGYLAQKFLEQNPSSLLMLDISEHNLSFAKEKLNNDRVTFLQQDATEPWKVDSNSVDVVYSNMMLNEVENIKTPIEEAYRILKKDGTFIFSVTHPAWDLFIYAQDKAGIHPKKILGLKDYFHRGFAKFIMGGHGTLNPGMTEEYEDETKEFEVEHYQRPISDYFNTLTFVQFTVIQMFEPELNEVLLKEKPRYESYKDHPLGLIFYCKKLL